MCLVLAHCAEWDMNSADFAVWRISLAGGRAHTCSP